MSEMIDRVKREIDFMDVNIGRDVSEEVARRIIAAIREPTEAMWTAPVQADCFVNGVYPTGEEAAAIWRAMIDASA